MVGQLDWAAQGPAGCTRIFGKANLGQTLGFGRLSANPDRGESMLSSFWYGSTLIAYFRWIMTQRLFQVISSPGSWDNGETIKTANTGMVVFELTPSHASPRARGSRGARVRLPGRAGGRGRAVEARAGAALGSRPAGVGACEETVRAERPIIRGSSVRQWERICAARLAARPALARGGWLEGALATAGCKRFSRPSRSFRGYGLSRPVCGRLQGVSPFQPAVNGGK
jgi:hypothetical protein